MLCLCNHSAGVHLRACASHRQDTAHRQQSLVLSGIFLLQPDLVPVVAFIIVRCGHGLLVVAYAVAAVVKDQVYLVLAGNLDALMQFL